VKKEEVFKVRTNLHIRSGYPVNKGVSVVNRIKIRKMLKGKTRGGNGKSGGLKKDDFQSRARERKVDFVGGNLKGRKSKEKKTTYLENP